MPLPLSLRSITNTYTIKAPIPIQIRSGGCYVNILLQLPGPVTIQALVPNIDSTTESVFLTGGEEWAHLPAPILQSMRLWLRLFLMSLSLAPILISGLERAQPSVTLRVHQRDIITVWKKIAPPTTQGLRQPLSE